MANTDVWTVAGSDSSAGAGLQSDLATFSSFGLVGKSVVTAITAQSSQRVLESFPVSASILKAQLNALLEDGTPRALKLGMLGSSEVVEVVAAFLEQYSGFVVCDPVLVSSSGHPLLEEHAVSVFIEKILPHVDLITPNLPEAEHLLKKQLKSNEEIAKAAQEFLKLGVGSVLIKGGHQQEKVSACDYWTDGENSFWLEAPFEPKDVHGTGCALSSAVAAAVTLGYNIQDSVVIAKSFVSAGIQGAFGIGKKSRFSHLNWKTDFFPLPKLWKGNISPSPFRFPRISRESLGFYPIVDSLEWLRILLPLGVRTAQLRIKNLKGEALESEIAAGIELAKKYDCKLFINDEWQLALKWKAYGVHLGQEDLDTAHLCALSEAGIALGVSTHCYEEVARALSLAPSYIAIGPIFPTTSKEMKFGPQGLEALSRWRQLLPETPLVAIGGITLENSESVFLAGADSIAVISDVTKNPNPAQRTTCWLECFAKGSAQAKG